jgi:hypothetical protein
LVQTVTDNIVEVSSAMWIKIFKGVKTTIIMSRFSYIDCEITRKSLDTGYDAITQIEL